MIYCMSNFQKLIKSTLRIYLQSLKKSISGVRKNLELLPGLSLLVIIYQFSFYLTGNFGYASGFIAAICNAIFLSFFYAAIEHCYLHHSSKSIFTIAFDYDMFSKVINVAFIFFIFEFILQLFFDTSGLNLARMFLMLGIYGLLNAIPETLIVHRYDGIFALQHTFQFIKENFIEWFPPLIIVLLPFFLGDIIFSILNVFTLNPMYPLQGIHALCFKYAYLILPRFLVTISLSPFVLITFLIIIQSFIFSLFGLFYMTFRCHLFYALDTSSRRKRIFMEGS
jgi:hypothetical protein